MPVRKVRQCRTPTSRTLIMKLFTLCFIALMSTASLAHAQVYFNSGSAKPNNASAARRDLERRSKPVAGKVRCGDGSRHIPRVCQRHGGIAGR